MNNTLAFEFVNRHNQLINDYKTHTAALDILEGEYRFKFEDTTTPPTYFFVDNSAADWVGYGWDIFPRVK